MQYKIFDKVRIRNSSDNSIGTITEKSLPPNPCYWVRGPGINGCFSEDEIMPIQWTTEKANGTSDTSL